MINWDNVPVGYNVQVKVEGSNGVYFYDACNAIMIEQISFMGMCVYLERSIVSHDICEVVEFRKGIFSTRFLDKVHCGYAIFNKGKDGKLHRVARFELKKDSVLMSASEAAMYMCAKGRETCTCGSVSKQDHVEKIREESRQEVLGKLPDVRGSTKAQIIHLLDHMDSDPMVKIRAEWGCEEAKAVEAVYEACRQYQMVREKDS